MVMRPLLVMTAKRNLAGVACKRVGLWYWDARHAQRRGRKNRRHTVVGSETVDHWKRERSDEG